MITQLCPFQDSKFLSLSPIAGDLSSSDRYCYDLVRPIDVTQDALLNILAFLAHLTHRSYSFTDMYFDKRMNEDNSNPLNLPGMK